MIYCQTSSSLFYEEGIKNYEGDSWWIAKSKTAWKKYYMPVPTTYVGSTYMCNYLPFS